MGLVKKVDPDQLEKQLKSSVSPLGDVLKNEI